MSRAIDRLKGLAEKISGYHVSRETNKTALETLYRQLHIDEKVPHFEDLFEFKAINLSGMTLTSEALGSIKTGKYVQIIAIRYEADAAVKNRNISLGYFGRAEKIDASLKQQIVSFVLRWRYEKSFMTLEHYHELLDAWTRAGDDA